MVIAWVDLMLPMLLHHSLKGAGMPDILIQTGRCPGKGHTEHAIQQDRLQWCKSIVFHQMERSAIGAGCKSRKAHLGGKVPFQKARRGYQKILESRSLSSPRRAI